jgi:glucokinase-like ROK family protein
MADRTGSMKPHAARIIDEPVQSVESNLARICELLRVQREGSCPQFAAQTGLSRTSVNTILDKLVGLGLAEQSGRADSSGGRRAALLRFRPDACFALGAALANGEWSTVITDLDARVLKTSSARVKDTSPESAVVALDESVAEVTSSVEKKRMLPVIGIGSPGLVDNGVVKSAVDLGWSDVPLARMVEARLGLRAVVANRSRVGALAELSDGAGRDVQDLVYVSIGTGVAAGIVHKRRLYLGANSAAGELGHVTVDPDGPLCPCGNRGCLQQLVSGPAIAQLARLRLREGGESALRGIAANHPEHLTAEDVFREAERGDALALDIVRAVSSHLAVAIANLVNLLNPQLIVLGGPVGRAGRALLPPLAEEVRRRAMAYPLSAVKIVVSALGPRAPAIGAAALVLQHSSQLVLTQRMSIA